MAPGLQPLCPPALTLALAPALALALALLPALARPRPRPRPNKPQSSQRRASRPKRNPSTPRQPPQASPLHTPEQVALDFAATHPECVEALILMDAGGESYAQPDPLTLP